MKDKKWNIDKESIIDDSYCCHLDSKYTQAKSVMQQRTRLHGFFSKISHNKSLYNGGANNTEVFSEGSTQAIKRKLRAQTIQRVPDGELVTQFDKNSIEQAEVEFIFKKKILTSEFDGRDMMKNLWRMFNASYDYGYACVRTGFEKDADNDVRISFTMIQWNDIFPDPDCKFIEEAEYYFVREYISRAELKNLLDKKGRIKDKTYDEKTVKYIIENDLRDGVDPNSVKMADQMNAVSPVQSIEVRTFYKRGADEFITYVPSLKARLRTVKNYDPRKDVPLHFMILEPDPEFPLGASSIMWTLAQQQYADAFQSVAYQTLLLAAQPPIMLFGNLTPSKIKMRPRAAWPMGTNPNNKVEPWQVETTTITNYGSILENISANMMKNLNVADGTVASDANVMHYSGTPQGVEAQRQDKTITVNQYQKRVEIFFSEWANHALRSYINAMSGEQLLTVDEETRRKIFDIEMSQANPEDDYVESIIEGDKIRINFSELSSDLLTFEVRTGSLIASERENEIQNIQNLLLPISQMIGQVSDQNKPAFEETLMQLIQRLCELSDIDISASTGANFQEALMMQAIQATMEEVMGQQQQIDQLAGMMPQQGLPQGGAPMMPAEEQPAMIPIEAGPMMDNVPQPNSEVMVSPGAEVTAESPELPAGPDEII